MSFRPCIDRNACTEDGTHCRGCGRSHEEINQLRQLINQAVALAERWEYDNLDDFTRYLAKKIDKKIQHARRKAVLSLLSD